jgi:hypothetical protein
MSGGVQPERWEIGSDLHAIQLQGPARWPWADDGVRFAASGREALRQLAKHLGARVVWLPDYCCQDLIAPLEAVGARVATYADDPRGPCGNPSAKPGDVLVRMNTWGLRATGGVPPPEGVVLVEDHTHDPFSDWARTSRAHFAFASLRKALPVADGGALWSPSVLPLPAALPASAKHRALSDERWRAMDLKAAWLEGAPTEKDAFRRLFVETEGSFAADLESGPSQRTMDTLSVFPADAWTAARRENLAVLERALRPGVARLLQAAPGATAFGATFELPTHEGRDRARAALTASRIFTAVLWPLDGPGSRASPEAIALSHRMLFVHCDGRYTASDMERVAARLNEVFTSA